MANLGNFAGGFAHGYTSGRDLQRREEEFKSNKDLRERQIKMQEQDQAWQEKERKRQDELYTGMENLNKEFGIGYGRQVPDGEVEQSDNAGNVVRVPKYKQAPPRSFDELTPGEQMNYLGKAMGLKIAKTGDASLLLPYKKWLTEAKATEEGQRVIEALNDPKKFDAYVTELGGDPTKAKFDREKYTLDLGNGKPPVDVRGHLFAAGADHALQFIRQNEQDNLQRRNVESSIGLRNEQAKTEGARRGQIGASAALANAKLKQIQDNAGLMVPKIVSDQVKAASTDPVDKKLNPELYAYIMSKMPGAKNPSQTMKAARDDFNKANQMADAYIRNTAKKLDEKARKAKYGTSDLAEIRRLTIDQMLGPVQPVGVAGGNLGLDDD